MRARAIVFLGALLAGAPCFGQWAVFVAANLQQSVANYAAMVEQIAREAEQIANQIRQIQQMEPRLTRMGNMSESLKPALESAAQYLGETMGLNTEWPVVIFVFARKPE